MSFSFTHFIAEAQSQNFICSLSDTSFLMNGTTDAGNVEDELVVALCCKKDDVSREIKSCARHLSDMTLKKADADGLVTALEKY